MTTTTNTAKKGKTPESILLAKQAREAKKMASDFAKFEAKIKQDELNKNIYLYKNHFNCMKDVFDNLFGHLPDETQLTILDIVGENYNKHWILNKE
jgi:hypothetical protein